MVPWGSSYLCLESNRPRLCVHRLSYYLASDEVEVKEAKEAKQRSFVGWPTLLKRSRLPRFILAHDDRLRRWQNVTLCTNVLSPSIHLLFLPSCVACSVEDVTGDEEYFHEDDFRVGES